MHARDCHGRSSASSSYTPLRHHHCPTLQQTLTRSSACPCSVMVLLCERTLAGRSASTTTPRSSSKLIHSHCASSVRAFSGLASVVSRYARHQSHCKSLIKHVCFSHCQRPCRRGEQLSQFRCRNQRSATNVGCVRAAGKDQSFPQVNYVNPIERRSDLLWLLQHGIHQLCQTPNRPSMRISRSQSQLFTTLSSKNCLCSNISSGGITRISMMR